MSVFNIERIKFDEKSDIEKVTKYLHKLNENLEYMFNNITPEDNYSSNALIRHIQEGDKVAEIAISVDGITQSVADADNRISQIKATVHDIELNMINKGNIISSINLSTEGVAIEGNKINLKGTVTANNNFVIKQDGTMECQNANISGTLNSAKIIGAKITGKFDVQCGRFWISNPGDKDDIRDFRIGLGEFDVRYDADRRCTVLESRNIENHGNTLRIYDGGDVICKDIKFNNKDYDDYLTSDSDPSKDWEYWSLLRILEDLEKRLKAVE